MALGRFLRRWYSACSAEWVASARLISCCARRDLFLALRDLEDGLLELRLELGDFEHGERLTLLDHVADVDVDLLHVAADLGVDVDHLVGLELAGEGEDVVDIAALRGGHAGGRNDGSLGSSPVDGRPKDRWRRGRRRRLRTSPPWRAIWRWKSLFA